MAALALPPPFRDEPANRRLVALLRPDGWDDPRIPQSGYDLVVVGGGSAGRAAARAAVDLGARVLLVERGLLGGAELLSGRVPLAALRDAAERVRAAGRTPDAAAFAAALAEARDARADAAAFCGAEALRDAGIGIAFGAARFEGPKRLVIDDASLAFRRTVLAAGSLPRAARPTGLAEGSARSVAEALEWDTRPERVAVLGGGPAACTLAQSLARLGCEVALVVPEDGILGGEDDAIAGRVAEALSADGVRVLAGVGDVRSEPSGRGGAGDGVRLLVVDAGGVEARLDVDEVVDATGSAPEAGEASGSIAALGLDLAAAGIACPGGRVLADDRLRTTNPRVFVAGAAAGATDPWLAEATGRLAARNALLPLALARRASALAVPRAVATAPEAAFVGLQPGVAAALGAELETLAAPLAFGAAGTGPGRGPDDAASAPDQAGLLRVHVVHGTDRIVGAAAIGQGAGDAAALIALAIERGLGLVRLADLAAPHGTGAAALASVARDRRQGAGSARSAVRAWLAARRLGRAETAHDDAFETVASS